MADTVINNKDPKNYINRELSWLQFNTRVLGEAKDKTTLPFERLKFLAITASNLDEFFMVRVASLDEMVHAGYKKKDIAGMTAEEQLAAIGTSVHELVESQYSCYNRGLVPLMHRLGLVIIPEHEELAPAEADFVDRYFEREVYPVLTPMAVDSSRPFPLVRNKSINIGVLMQKKKSDEDMEFAMVRVPDVLPRVVEIPEDVENLRGDEENPKPRRIIYLEEIIERNIGKLFLNYKILASHPFRIMRNADLSIEEDESEDLLKEIVQNNLEKEALQAKMHIHDEIGQALILTRNALETKESPMEMDNLYSMWENLIRDMENAAVSKNVKVSDPEEELKQVAAMIGCRVRFSGRQPRERKALLLLYAGIREALTNAVRHAGADELLVEIKESGSFYEVSIGSNGTRPVESTVREGRGLGGLRKRIESEGGEMNVRVSGSVVLELKIPRGENTEG